MDTIIDLGNGKFGFQSREPDSQEPIMRTWIWPLGRGRIEGMCGHALTDAIGREARCNGGHVSCYLGNGGYFRADMPELGSTKALSITEEPIPRPVRVRGEVRWYRGQWQKYNARKGWINI